MIMLGKLETFWGNCWYLFQNTTMNLPVFSVLRLTLKPITSWLHFSGINT